ncbi:MAG: DUF4129 domain-containing protein [Nitrospira sp.]|nr:DUF4129 domain-containing protein [Nitrospira sp.]
MKSASATPMEVLRHVRDEWAEAWPSADALTRLYTRVRFGHAPSLPKTIPLPKPAAQAPHTGTSDNSFTTIVLTEARFQRLDRDKRV